MKLVCALIPGLLLLCLALTETQSRVLQPSLDIRSLFPKMSSAAQRRSDPDIDPSWYTGRGIRPVGRFGRRGTAWEEAQQSMYRSQGQTCVPIQESTEFIVDN
ncbi:prolactin-releasing peptide [Pelobates cultripes]|uniref:Prolactin-releasing peptide n=1 Tax=Pelobates cultripes TaxID=61616 RepID=A0AAD1WHV6_PELCU|nr:prolactin-releasing peptide [Pelobates cultripes]